MAKPEQTNLIVIGGGVTGLCAAWYASQDCQPESIVLLEAAERPGGQTGTDRIDGFVCDWGPNGFLDREPATLEWIEGIGAAGSLVKAPEMARHRFIFKDDRLIEVVGPPRFFLSPLLSLRGRARLCCEPLIKTKRDDSPESIWHFAARRIGREAADMMVNPMVSGVFAGDARRLSLAHCFPRMAAMEKRYGGLVKALLAIRREDKSASPMGPRGTLTSFETGIGHLPEIVARRLSRRVRTGLKVTRLTGAPGNGGYIVETDRDKRFEAPRVIVALPAHQTASITADMDPQLSRALAAIPYADLTVVCVGYRREDVSRDLNGFGFLIPRNQGCRALGCLWTSSIFPNRAPDGWVQLRVMYGGYTDPEAVHLTDRELLDNLARDIHPVMGIECEPRFVRIYRHSPGIPQYVLDHGRKLEAVEAAERRHQGLAFAGNAYRGVGLNECVLSARRAVTQCGLPCSKD